MVKRVVCSYCNKYDVDSEKLYDGKLACQECIDIFSKYDIVIPVQKDVVLPSKYDSDGLSGFVISMLFFVGLGLITGMILALSGM